MGEDNEQLPQHGTEPEQCLKYRKAGQSVMEAKLGCPLLSGVGLGCPHGPGPVEGLQPEGM